MKKKLNTENITNELEGASLFFARTPTPPPSEAKAVEPEPVPIPVSPAPVQEQSAKVRAEIVNKPEIQKDEQTNSDTTTPRSHDTVVSSNNASLQASNNASMHASKHSYNQESIVETIRKVVK